MYSAQGGNGQHFHSQEESQMDLDELAKHIGIKVSAHLADLGCISLNFEPEMDTDPESRSFSCMCDFWKVQGAITRVIGQN